MIKNYIDFKEAYNLDPKTASAIWMDFILARDTTPRPQKLTVEEFLSNGDTKLLLESLRTNTGANIKSK